MTDPEQPAAPGADEAEASADTPEDPGGVEVGFRPDSPALVDMPADSLAAVALDGADAGPSAVLGTDDPPQPSGPPASSVSAESAEPSLTAESIAVLRRRPTYVFFGVLAALSLALDIGSKAWAEVELSKRTLEDPSIVLLPNHLMFTLAYNRGGAWGLLHDASENIRKPFFLAVSVLAIAFIVSLYSRLAPGQRALKWGLPLVLGGALGNLSDRIIRSSVVDFIDFRADWIGAMNRGIAKLSKGWTITDHWPTFNVADIFICIGVGLMAVDMITSRRSPEPKKAQKPEVAPTTAEPVDEGAAVTKLDDLDVRPQVDGAAADAPTDESAAPASQSADAEKPADAVATDDPRESEAPA
jgi:signal peptidase II